MAANKKKQSDQMDIFDANSELILEDPVVTAAIHRAENAANSPHNPSYSPVPVKRFVMTTDEMDDYLSHAQLSDDSMRELGIGKSKKKQSKKLEQTVTMSEEVMSPLLASLNLSAYDRAVLEAVYSQILASPVDSNCLFSVRGLYRIMCGVEEGRFSCSDEQKKMICDTIQRLMGTVVTLQATAINRNGEEIVRTTTFNLLSAKIDQVNIGGSDTTSIRILSYPEFLAFARQKGGLTATPLDMLCIPDLSMTVRNTAIVNYLQHLITNVTFGDNAKKNRNKLRQHNELVINYSAIYDCADSKPLVDLSKSVGGTYPRTYTSRVRSVVHSILDSWQSRGYIDGWEDLKSSRNQIYAVCVKLIGQVVEQDDTL